MPKGPLRLPLMTAEARVRVPMEAPGARALPEAVLVRVSALDHGVVPQLALPTTVEPAPGVPE